MFDRFIAFRARQSPEAIAIAMPLGELSFGVLDVAVGRVAAALAAEPRPRFAAVLIADPYLHWLALLGLARLGVASASVSPGEADALLPWLRADLVVADGPAPDAAAAGSPRWLHAGADWFGEALAAGAGVPATHPPVADSMALGRVVLSSGTTGRPKKVVMSWADVDARVSQIALWGAGSRDPRRFLALLEAGIGGFVPALAAWSLGGTVLFAPRDPAALAQALPRLDPTWLVASPAQVAALLAALPPDASPRPNLVVTLAGSHAPLSLRRAVARRLTAKLAITYGSTEANITSTGSAARLGDDEAACGWVVPGVEIEVVDDAGRAQPFGAPGLVRLRGATVARGYLDDPAATAAQFRDGWFTSGDIGTLAADGALRIEGRADERMNFGGVKALPAALESAALLCPGVADAAAFARPGDDGLDRPWLALVRGDGFDAATLEEALDAALRDRVPGLPPVRVAWIAAVPRNAGGKIERGRLADAAAALG